MLVELRTFAEAGILTLLVLFLLLSGCGPKSRQWEGALTRGGVNFSDRDRVLIRRFYSRFEFPPEGVPEVVRPDPEEWIERSAVLPPDPSGMPLPAELEEQLSRLPPGHIRFRVGEDVVLMDSRTREVLDVIHDVFQ